MKPRRLRPAYVLALCALLAALGTALMLASGLVPVLTYCSPLAAGLMLVPVLYEFGRRQAWMTWAVTAVLSLLLCADKEAAFFYLFLGSYPIVKGTLDRVLGRAARLAAKLAFFALALALMYGLLLFVLRLEALWADLGGFGLPLELLLYAALVAVMLLYDRVVAGMTRLYQTRLRPRLRSLR